MTAPGATARTMMYLCYGRDEVFDQAIYSILTLLHVEGAATRDYRVVVYADRPERFAALPVETVALDAAVLDAWLDGTDYLHRRKTMAILDALDRFGGKVLFVDTDTWFKRSPAPLFDRIGRGRACLHIAEGRLTATGTPYDRALARQLAAGDYRLGDARVAPERAMMWNTGVVGVDADDRARVEAALALSDAIWAGADPAGVDGRKIHHAEQFAMGCAFGDGVIREAADIVYHYWLGSMKRACDAALPDLAASGLADRSPANLDRLYARRCRETGTLAWRDTAKMAVRRLAQRLDIPVRGVRRSVG